MGHEPIQEEADIVEIPDDGRLCLGEDYAHRKVPLEICVPEGEPGANEAGEVEYTVHSVEKRPADGRGRVNIPADVREQHDRIFYAVSEPAVEHGSLGEAYDALVDAEWRN